MAEYGQDGIEFHAAAAAAGGGPLTAEDFAASGYNAGDNADWSPVPGDPAEALDQLAERVTDLEGAGTTPRLQVSTTFEDVTDRYTIVLNNGTIEVTDQGLNVSAGNTPDDGSGLFVYGSNVGNVFNFDKNPEFAVHCRYDNVDMGVGGDDIDFWIGWGPVFPSDFTDSSIGLVFNPVDQSVSLSVGNGATRTVEALTGATGDDWATYRVTFDGVTVNAYYNGVLAASINTTLPAQNDVGFTIGAKNRTDVENAGRIQVTFLAHTRDF